MNVLWTASSGDALVVYAVASRFPAARARGSDSLQRDYCPNIQRAKQPFSWSLRTFRKRRIAPVLFRFMTAVFYKFRVFENISSESMH